MCPDGTSLISSSAPAHLHPVSPVSLNLGRTRPSRTGSTLPSPGMFLQGCTPVASAEPTSCSEAVLLTQLFNSESYRLQPTPALTYSPITFNLEYLPPLPFREILFIFVAPEMNLCSKDETTQTSGRVGHLRLQHSIVFSCYSLKHAHAPHT